MENTPTAGKDSETAEGAVTIECVQQSNGAVLTAAEITKAAPGDVVEILVNPAVGCTLKEGTLTYSYSKKDENGTIKSANYGSIRRFEIGPSRRGVALLRLSYVFNPTPNDTNLEPK